MIDERRKARPSIKMIIDGSEAEDLTNEKPVVKIMSMIDRDILFGVRLLSSPCFISSSVNQTIFMTSQTEYRAYFFRLFVVSK